MNHTIFMFYSPGWCRLFGIVYLHYFLIVHSTMSVGLQQLIQQFQLDSNELPMSIGEFNEYEKRVQAAKETETKEKLVLTQEKLQDRMYLLFRKALRLDAFKSNGKKDRIFLANEVYCLCDMSSAERNLVMHAEGAKDYTNDLAVNLYVSILAKQVTPAIYLLLQKLVGGTSPGSTYDSSSISGPQLHTLVKTLHSLFEGYRVMALLNSVNIVDSVFHFITDLVKQIDSKLLTL